MRARALLVVFVGMLGAGACVVPSFQVDPPTTGSGGDAAGGTTAGSRATAGTGGKATAGTGGKAPTAGGSNEAGATYDGPGPVRVGFSIFHDSAGGSDDASGNSKDAIFTKPAETKTGDFMLVFLGVDHHLTMLAQADLTPSGWTLLYQHGDYGDDGQGTYLLYKFATAGEPDSIVFAGINPEGYGVQGLLSVYRGVNAASPINDIAPSILSSGGDSVHVDTPTPPITTTVDNCLLIAGLSPDTAVDAPTIATWPEGFDDNQMSVVNPTTPMPFGWTNIYMAERHQSSAGAVPGSLFGWDMTYGGSHYDGSLTFVLALAP